MAVKERVKKEEVTVEDTGAEEFDPSLFEGLDSMSE